MGGTDPARYKALEFSDSLVLDGKSAISISPDGRYALTVNVSESSFNIFENKGTRYEFLTTVNVPEDTPNPEKTALTFQILSGMGIAWSKDSSKFSFGYFDILLCDIAKRTITKLTELPENNNDEFSKNTSGGILVSIPMSVWSDEGKTVYFVRQDYIDENIISEICSVPIAGGDVKVELAFNLNEGKRITSVFAENNSLYYLTIDSNLNAEIVRMDIESGKETRIMRLNEVSLSIPNSIILDVSPDGTRLLFTTAETLEEGLGPRHFYLLNTEKHDLVEMLYPISNSSDNQYNPIQNVLMSPDGRSLLQIEASSYDSPPSMYIRDVEDINALKTHVYESVDEIYMVGSLSHVMMNGTLKPEWLTNDIIVMNSYQKSFLLKVIK
jgi:Tol biopolymer transport system component